MNSPVDFHGRAAARPVDTGTTLPLRAVEQGWLPDILVRAGIRRLLRERLAEIGADNPAASAAVGDRFATAMCESAVALVPELANAQHYEVPAEFFGLVLGNHRKYSGCLWPAGVRTLEDAEAAALAATCRHAELADGQHIL